MPSWFLLQENKNWDCDSDAEHESSKFIYELNVEQYAFSTTTLHLLTEKERRVSL